MHIAALQQGGLAWPCPAWLQPSDTPAGPSPPPEADPTGRADTIMGSDDNSSADSDSNDDSPCVSSNGINASSLPSEPVIHGRAPNHTAAVNSGQPTESHANAVDSSTGSDCDSESESKHTSDSNSDSNGARECDNKDALSEEEADSSDSDTCSEGAARQAAFTKLDSLFAGGGASVSTHLAALDLLKRGSRQSKKSGMKATRRMSKAGPNLSAGLGPKATNVSLQQQLSQQHQQQQTSKAKSCLSSKSNASLRGAKPVGVDNKNLAKQQMVKGKCGASAPETADWVQMQDGGNPLYLQQKNRQPATGEQSAHLLRKLQLTWSIQRFSMLLPPTGCAYISAGWLLMLPLLCGSDLKLYAYVAFKHQADKALVRFPLGAQATVLLLLFNDC